MLDALILASIPLSCIALLISCVSLAVIVGFKNSTHRIEWKTYDPERGEVSDKTPEVEEEDDDMLLENPNKRIKRNVPFTPFPDSTPKEEEPFFDENDPNNTSHDFG